MASIQLADFGEVPDGRYNYRLVIKSGPKQLLVDNGNNGRDPDEEYYGVKGQVQSGHFYVKNGNIHTFDQIKEPEYR